MFFACLPKSFPYGAALAAQKFEKRDSSLRPCKLLKRLKVAREKQDYAWNNLVKMPTNLVWFGKKRRLFAASCSVQPIPCRHDDVC
jgi:hypothetical protein